jgi:arylformamidase
MTTTGTPRRADIDSFYTCSHAAQFKINWRVFYTAAEERTDHVRERWPHELDIAYGPNVRQRLDLYFPELGSSSSASARPVLLFLHGGGFREGDPALYGYLAEPYVKRGIIFGSLGYRLTPEAYLKDSVRDVEDALAWCFSNLAARGGDPTRIVLAGHSAGAILSAHVALRSDWLAARGLPLDLLKAIVPISGVYDFSNPAERTEFFATDADRIPNSPLLNVVTAPQSTIVAYGGRENQPNYGKDSRRLVDAIRARGGQAELLLLEPLDHSDTVSALADEASPLFQSVAALFSAVRGSPTLAR